MSAPTTYLERFSTAIFCICRDRPPIRMVEAWLTPGAEDERLQEWVLSKDSMAPEWMQGIAILAVVHGRTLHVYEGREHRHQFDAEVAPNRDDVEWARTNDHDAPPPPPAPILTLESWIPPWARSPYAAAPVHA